VEHVNEVFAEFAARFAGSLAGEGEIVFAAHLDRARLDYSIDSLKAVDEYLAHLRANQPPELGADWAETVLWGGAYVGEVIRRNAAREYHWIDFDDFLAEYPNTTQILGEEKGLGFCALLTAGGGGFTLPINKLLRDLHDGPQDSVWTYAAGVVKE
jgi:hypothetical protein